MPDLLVTATMERVSGLAADRVTNSWVVRGGSAINDDLGATLMAFQKFYWDLPPGQGTQVGSMLSTSINRAAGVLLQAYDITDHLDGSPHGSPVHTLQSPALPAATGTALPDEVAICLSLKATGHDAAPVNIPAGAPGPEGDLHPRARHAGRVFIGPLTTYALQLVNGYARVSGTAANLLLAAGSRLHNDLAAISGGNGLGVWSRTDAVVRRAVRLEIDNEFDTQRRRGTKATGKTTTALAD